MLQKFTNRIGLIIPIIVFGIFAGTLVYLLFYQSMSEVANIIDFTVAMMSTAVVIITYVRNNMDKREQYTWVSSIYIVLLMLGLVVFMIAAINIKDASDIARVLSCICLGITILQEIISIIKIEHRINVEGEQKQEAKIKEMESETNT